MWTTKERAAKEEVSWGVCVYGSFNYDTLCLCRSHRRPSDPYERGYNQLQSRPKRKEVDEQHTGGRKPLPW